jgi:molybdopterin-guanine dinucleotide biosynthesis protein A
MKQDKTQMLWQGQSLLRHQFDKCSQLTDLVVVSGNHSDFPSVKDEIPDRGPLEGVRSALKNLNTKISNLSAEADVSVLILPADMPLISVDSLRKLKSELQNNSQVQVVRFHSLEMPILFRNSKQVLECIEDLSKCTNKKYSFRELIKYFNPQEILEVNTIEIENKEFLNTNTPEDWCEAISSSNYSA